jgi:3-methyladenine DNA glycosylase AlkD
MAGTNIKSIEARASVMIERFERLRNIEKERQFQSYLKSNQPMFGVNAGPRKEVLKSTLKTNPIQSVSEYYETILDFWNRPEREFQYCAIDTACKFKKFHTLDAWATFEHLALTAKWWDLTDSIAVNLIGSLLRKDRDIQIVLDIWANDSDLWIRRTSLLAHLKHKECIDIDSVKRTILTLAPDKQFFIQKAIGWMLREYSKTNPDWVVAFIDSESEQLSNLAIREGTKFVNR